MIIGIDTQSTLGRKTGIGRYTAGLLAALRETGSGHEYVALQSDRDLVMRTDRRLRWQQFELPRRARAAGAALLHVTGFDAPVWKPCPVVLTVHDLIGSLFPHHLPPVSRMYWARWLPFTVRLADAVIVNSETTRRDLERLTQIPQNKVVVVPWGVDKRFHPQPEPIVSACRTRYALPERFVLNVGTLEPRKGIDTLIEAFAPLAHRYPHDLVLAGQRGWSWQPILDRIAAHNLGDRVHVLDYVPDDDLPPLYAAATIFSFPSRYEGFGFPVLEAMACGTPVVCSNAASLPEVVGRSALLVPPDDAPALTVALERAAADTKLSDMLCRRGLEQARKFTWERTAQATLTVYRQVMEARVPAQGGP